MDSLIIKQNQALKKYCKINLQPNARPNELTNVSELSKQVASLEKKLEEVVDESTKKDEALKIVRYEKAALESTQAANF